MLKFDDFVAYKKRCIANNLDSDHTFYNFNISANLDRHPATEDEELLKKFDENIEKVRQARLKEERNSKSVGVPISKASQ